MSVTYYVDETLPPEARKAVMSSFERVRTIGDLVGLEKAEREQAVVIMNRKKQDAPLMRLRDRSSLPPHVQEAKMVIGFDLPPPQHRKPSPHQAFADQKRLRKLLQQVPSWM